VIKFLGIITNPLTSWIWTTYSYVEMIGVDLSFSDEGVGLVIQIVMDKDKYKVLRNFIMNLYGICGIAGSVGWL